MNRRNTRLRREYLYRKSLEGKEKELYEKKRKIREALESGTKLPPEVRTDPTLLHQARLEDDNTAVPRTHVDDEYANAGEEDPFVMLTTSRSPSTRLVAFAKELKLLVPNSIRVNRGGLVLPDLVATARAKGATDILVVHEHRGEPDGLTVCHLPYGPTAYFGLHNAVLRHDIGARKDVGTISEAYPHLVFHNLTTPLGARVATILKHLFPVPKPDSKRVLSFINTDDYVSFRHHTYEAPRGKASVELTEVGPRWEMRLYQIRLGTLEQAHAENEFLLRAYIRSSKRARLCEVGQGEAQQG